MTNNIPRWRDNTREERYFTAILFHALLIDVDPFWERLRPRLNIPTEVAVVDIGYEVCMLRDLAHAKHIERIPPLEKQTFDLVLTLSNDALVLIEAKAHQGFSMNQVGNMRQSAKILQENTQLGISDVHIAGLHSSKYSPVNVRAEFPALTLVTWEELTTAYTEPETRRQLQRANDIYNN